VHKSSKTRWSLNFLRVYILQKCFELILSNAKQISTAEIRAYFVKRKVCFETPFWKKAGID